MKPEQFIREYGPNTFRISMSFVNTAKYLVVHEGEIDFTDEIKPHHGDRVFERSVVKRLVESLDEIELYGGIELFKEHVNGVALMLCGTRIHPEVKRLDRILKDHESIYGGGENA